MELFPKIIQPLTKTSFLDLCQGSEYAFLIRNLYAAASYGKMTACKFQRLLRKNSGTVSYPKLYQYKKQYQ